MEIFNPITINNLTLPNRLVVGAMLTALSDADGAPTERMIRYYERKAKGNWGLIITEDFAVAYQGGASVLMPGLYNDHLAEQYRTLTKRVHAVGGRIACQIYHAGRVGLGTEIAGHRPYGPSAVQDPKGKEIPLELTKEQIALLVEKFGETAYRAKLAGFDAVEIHGASGYLIGQFVSPFSNKRTDEYGGTTKNRARFALEVVRKVREAVGPDFPVLYRMSTNEMIPGGLGIEEAKAIAIMLEEAGIDAIHCTQGNMATARKLIPSYPVDKGSLINNAAEIKRVVRIPVIGVGGHVNDPYLAEEILRSGKADLVTMARASLADPDLPIKMQQGHYEDINQCIGCVQGCQSPRKNIEGIHCLVNPLIGREDVSDFSLVEKPKKILVAGGGVSGCEFALVAAMRGHHVTLVEQASCLGGQWRIASVPYGKADFAGFVSWQERQLRKLGVQIICNQVVNADFIAQQKPDVLVAATGSRPTLPPIKGLEEANVVLASEILAGKKTCGRKVAIVGGGSVGAETAEFLAVQGCEVTIIEMFDAIARTAIAGPRSLLLDSLKENGVTMYTNTKVIEAGFGKLTLLQENQEIILENLDTIVVAAGSKPNNEWLEGMNFDDCEIVSIGDANHVKDGYSNIQEAYIAGLNIK